MNPRLGFALLAGFGALIVLTAILGVSQNRRAAQIRQELTAAQEAYSATEALLSQTRVDLYRIGMDVRDYLLDRNVANSNDMKQELLATQSQVRKNLEMLESRLSIEHREPLQNLRREVDEYFLWMATPLDWSQTEKLAYSGQYVRTVLLQRRKVISDLAEQLQSINTANLQRSQQRLDAAQESFQSWLRRLTAIVLSMSILIAALTITWILRLEKKAEMGHQRAESAERELRRLSQQLVRTQEDERRSLSRELHDEVGQQLTALRVEISNLGRIPITERDQFTAHLKETKSLAEKTMRTVRDLAMGLRPSMLDDLGLAPAIEWQAREFSRRNGVPSTVRITGSLSELSDTERTSLFRIVQEALTNITKHARATEVDITLDASPNGVRLRVKDNGRGMDSSSARGHGLGLLGIEERARELGADFILDSAPGQGTSIEIHIPRRLAA